jgi:hypothetical protein
VRLRISRPVPLHPLAFAAVPLLVLYARNVREGVPVRDLLGPMGVVLGVTVAIVVALSVTLRNVRKGALVGSLLVALFFAFGPVTDALGAGGRTEIAVLVVSVAMAVGAGVAVARARAGTVTGFTKGLNVVALGLLVLNVGTAVVTSLGTRTGVVRGDVLSAGLGPAESTSAARAHRDIFLIVLDDYGGERAMRELLGYDNGPFLDALRARGFFVPAHPTTNYPHTSDALGAELNLDYVQRLLRDPPEDEWAPANALLQHDTVPAFLKDHGYRYVHIGSWWHPTATNPQADVNVTMRGSHSEFTSAFIDQTIPSSDRGPLGSLTFGQREYARVLFQLKELAEAQQLAGPTFVFAHLLTPHRPFVFAADGHYVDNDERQERTDLVNYVNQLTYVNSRVLKLVDTLLAVPPVRRPVIVLQSDEGFYSGLDQGSVASNADLEQHFGTLEAFYFPGLKRTGLYDSITLVNVFRVLFDDYFGTKLAVLADRNYVFRDPAHLYQFVDVTDRVRLVS